MLEESFIFLQGIQELTEKKIWKQGINNWKKYLENDVKGISNKKKSYHRKQIFFLQNAIKEKNEKIIYEQFPKKHTWRLYDLFGKNAIFLDIETTYRNNISVIGLYNGEEQKFLVQGKNLNKENLIKALEEAKMIITFNGRSFDIPIIEKYFGIKIEKPHLDLMHACRKIGLVGGLKAIEKKIGINRPEEIKTADGSDAVLLWNSYIITEDEEYLMKLLLYNEQDCINLKTLAEFVIPKLWEKIRYT